MNFPKLKKAIVAGVSVMAAAAIVLGAAGCGGGQKADDGKPAHVKLGYSPAVCNAALFAAYENGYFKEEGLDIELVQVDAAHISDAVGAGQVDAFQGMASKLVQPLENGLPVQAVSGMHTGCQKVLVPADSPIKTVADLKGKQVGVPGLADAGTILVKRAASREGISVQRKTWKSISAYIAATTCHRHSRRALSMLLRHPIRWDRLPQRNSASAFLSIMP